VARMEKIRMASQKLRSGNEMGCYGIMSNWAPFEIPEGMNIEYLIDKNSIANWKGLQWHKRHGDAAKTWRRSVYLLIL
jgi:hypothetical protein